MKEFKPYSTANQNCDNKNPEQGNVASLEVVAEITCCATSPNHSLCTGDYVDATRAYVVKCLCPCHSDSNYKHTMVKENYE